MQCW